MPGYVLLEDMSHGRTYFSGGHIFQDNMSYGSMSYGRHALWEDMSFMSSCLQDGIYYRRICLIGRLSYGRTCLTGCFFFYRMAYLIEDVFYRKICLAQVQVLLEGMFCSRIYHNYGHDLLMELSYRSACSI